MPTNPNHGYLTEPKWMATRTDHTRTLAWLATGLAMAVIFSVMAIMRVAS